MQDGFKEKCVRVIVGVVLAVIVIVGLVAAAPNYRKGQALRRQEAELQAQIDAKKREIAELVDNQRRFRTDPDFVEMIARQNRRVFPGELVFIFEKE